MNLAKKFLSIARLHRKTFCLVAVSVFVAGIAILVLNYFIVGSYGKYIIGAPATMEEKLTVGIVLGGGIEHGKPRPLLQDRLDTAASLVKTGKVRKLIVSGDNRFLEYNEPQVMKNYLVQEKGIHPAQVQLDNAGRSTYETCERARKVFGLTRVILISESTHLPRAIYLCRSFGIEAYGFKSDGQSSAGLRVGQRFREIMARTKATLNVYVIGEHTVLGEKIKL